MKYVLKCLQLLLKVAIGSACIGIALVILASLFFGSGMISWNGNQTQPASYAVTQRYNKYITNTLSEVLDGVLSIDKVYWLSDDELVAPEPKQICYGTVKDPAELQWLLDDAAKLLDGQETLFQTDTPIWPGSEIMYYLDETILTITWKQILGNSVYTISEVKIADPSQFRRFLADGTYASGSKYVATEMAQAVNAVVAANGDFYTYRETCIVVYDSQLMRMEGKYLDTCFIAGNGDLLFAQQGDLTDREETEAFIQEHGVRFSLVFGPALIENGEKCTITRPYYAGEIDTPNARAALCQMDSLHYLLVAVNSGGEYRSAQTLPKFQDCLYELGCLHAYNLDGGQSATIVMNDKRINDVWMRQISDIIYFATAVPDEQ